MAVAGLLTGALVWGLIWYPYRILRDAGIDGIPATTLTYAVALILALIVLSARAWRDSGSWAIPG